MLSRPKKIVVYSNLNLSIYLHKIRLMLKFILWLIGILLLLYVVICLFFYFFQERLIFYPTRLSSDVEFSYTAEFEEHFFEVEEGVRLHGLLFRARPAGSINSDQEHSSKGLVFYLHGNAGALDSWGYAADVFLAEGYDVFILDYRGYGKSEGTISSKKQFLADVELVWKEISKQYRQEEIIITGFSIGSGPAAWLASQNKPKMLILQAPYYSLKDLAKRYFPVLPAALLRYNFTTAEYLRQVEAPVVLMHGTADEIIPYESSLMIKEALGEKATLYSLEGLGHNNMSFSREYIRVIREVLRD